MIAALIELAKNHKFLSNTLGVFGLLVVLVVTKPYWDRGHGETSPSVVLDSSLFVQKLEAHERQMQADQRADEARDLVLEDLLREAVEQQRSGNAVAREQLRLQKCVTAARNDDARRACAGTVR